MSTAGVMREYLIALGFDVNPQKAKKAEDRVEKINKQVFALGKAVTGTMVAAQAMVVAFASSMEKLYYDSRLANSTASRLQALGSGAERIGIGADRAKGAVIGMAMAMRQNPGLQALLEQYGVKVTGRDMSDVWKDMVDLFRKMPFYQGAQFAEMFGLDPETFLLAAEGLDKMRVAEERRAELNKEMGVDADKAAKASVEYMNTLRDVGDQFAVLKDAASIALLEPFKEIASVTKEVLKDWTAIFNKAANRKDGGSFWNDLRVGLFGMPSGSGVVLAKPPGSTPRRGGTRGEANAALGVGPELYSAPGYLKGNAAVNVPLGPGGKQAYLSALEQKYGLPSGILDRMWAKESARGVHLLSAAGAKGDFQFMDDTAKEYGVDVSSFTSSANGAARFLKRLLDSYGGDLQMALAAYNWGPGNLNKYGLGKAPTETRDYMKMAEGLTYAPTTTINVMGADAADAAQLINRELDRRDSTAVRHLQTVVQ